MQFLNFQQAELLVEINIFLDVVNKIQVRLEYFVASLHQSLYILLTYFLRMHIVVIQYFQFPIPSK